MNAGRVAAKAVLATADIFLPRLQGPRILIYHQVGSGRTHEMNVELPVFCQQIKWMQNHGEIVSLDEAVKRRGEPNADRLFVITFDDGYADMFNNAFPVLREFMLPFTLYLTTGPTENRDRFRDWPGEPLSWQQVQRMLASNLATIGAHTNTHCDLRKVDSISALEEIDASNALIEARTGVKPRHFTYPWGRWSPVADPIVRAAYETATLGSGSGISIDSDLHTLHRLPIQRSDPMLSFRGKITNGGRAEDQLRRRIHRYNGP